MRLALPIVVALAVAPRAAYADATFEDAAGGAEAVHDQGALIWVLTAPCDRGDDVEQRQCRLVRDARRRELAGRTLLLEADPGALEAGAWDAAKKSVAVTLAGCVRCTGLEVDGKLYFVIGSGTPRVDGKRLRGNVVSQTARAFLDQPTAAAWAKTLVQARVQMLVKVPEKPRWTDGTRQAVQLDIVGYRAYLPCDGTVIVASPPSTSVAPDPHRCTPADATPVAAAAPVAETLTPDAIRDAMKPVAAAARQCFEKLHAPGTATLKLTVAADGTVTKAEQTGDFVGTPTAACIDKAVASVRLPPSKQAITTFSFPIRLQ